MKPMLDPKRDLKGATPETLARALFRKVESPHDRREEGSGDRDAREPSQRTARGACDLPQET